MIPGTRLVIWTHEGKAHLDELMACSILILRWALDRVISVKDIPEGMVCINRVYRDRIPAVLSPGEFIVDTGGVHDGESRFDHHQLKNTTCAAQLVTERYMPELMKDPGWKDVMQAVSKIDSQGIFSAGAPVTRVRSLMAHAWLLSDLFRVDPVPAAMTYARGLELKRRSLLYDADDASDWVRRNIKMLRVTGCGLNAGVLTRDPRLDGIDPYLVHTCTKKVCRDWKLRILYSWCTHSEPGTNRTLVKSVADKGIDFRKCTPVQPIYCNSNGSVITFMDEDWMTLVNQACCRKNDK